MAGRRAALAAVCQDPHSQPNCSRPRTRRGPGAGSVENITSLATLENPVVNWQVFEDTTESDAYGSVVGDFSTSISAETAVERCGQGTLFPCSYQVKSPTVLARVF